jgi:tetratricopeptide (TPR) repeat protein
MKIVLRFCLALAIVAPALGVLPARAQPPQETEFDRAAGIVEKVRAGQTTLEKAFDDGLLTRPVLLAIVGEEQALDPGRGFWNPGEETYRWTGFLIQKYPEIFGEQLLLGSGVRLRIALYFFRERDPRGAQIMEQMLKEQPRENPDTKILMAVLSNLSKYYRATGETQKALDTALKVREFDVPPASQANILLNAARAAEAGGDKASAKDIYHQIESLGYGWATGQARIGLAYQLFAEGKLEEGRAMLKKPIEGLNGDQIRVVVNDHLARSYLGTGEFDEARKWAQAAVTQYEALGAPIKNHGLESFYESSKRMPQEIEQAQNNPVQLGARQIRVQMPANADVPVRTYFSVNARRALTIRVSANDPAIKVWIFRDPQGLENFRYQNIGVEVGPEILKSGGRPEVTVSFAELPDKIFHIPVNVVVK